MNTCVSPLITIRLKKQKPRTEANGLVAKSGFATTIRALAVPSTGSRKPDNFNTNFIYPWQVDVFRNYPVTP